jgi:hypothetical protein
LLYRPGARRQVKSFAVAKHSKCLYPRLPIPPQKASDLSESASCIVCLRIQSEAPVQGIDPDPSILGDIASQDDAQ